MSTIGMPMIEAVTLPNSDIVASSLEVARLYLQETSGIHKMVGNSNILDCTRLKRSCVHAIHMDGANITRTQILLKGTIFCIVKLCSAVAIKWYFRGRPENHTLHTHHCNNPYSDMIILLVHYLPHEVFILYYFYLNISL